MSIDDIAVSPPHADFMHNDEVLACIGRLVGTLYVPSVKAYISEVTGRGRVVGPTDMSTMEIDHTRVQIAVNDAGLIDRFYFT